MQIKHHDENSALIEREEWTSYTRNILNAVDLPQEILNSNCLRILLKQSRCLLLKYLQSCVVYMAIK